MNTEQQEEEDHQGSSTSILGVITGLQEKVRRQGNTVRNIRTFIGVRYTQLKNQVIQLKEQRDFDLEQREEEKEKLEERIQALEVKLATQGVDINRLTNTNSLLLRRVEDLNSQVQALTGQVRNLSLRILGEEELEDLLQAAAEEEDQEPPEQHNIVLDQE